jgi:hypothetical protein
MILVYGRRTDQRAGRDSDSEICGHRSSYPMFLINQRYRRPPVECAAGMADSERPQLAQTDVEVLRYFEKRMLIIELCDSYTRGVTASTVVTVSSENNRKLIIERGVPATEAHDHKLRLWPGQHTGQQLERRP